MNDNLPRRVVDKVFHVVTNGQRIITSHDLWYHDDDVTDDDADLTVLRHGVINGEIYNATSNKKVFVVIFRNFCKQKKFQIK